MYRKLLIGMSHIGCVAKALSDDERKYTAVVHLGLKEDKKQEELKGRSELEVLQYLADKYCFDDVWFCFGGNEHNVLALIEYDNRICVVDNVEKFRSYENRTLISYEILRRMFHDNLAKSVALTRKCEEVFSGSNLMGFLPPPPISDAKHILENPSSFSTLIEKGVTPKSIRKRVYEIQLETYLEMVGESKIRFIYPPQASLDSDGLLRERYAAADPTHANASYGQLMIELLSK